MPSVNLAKQREQTRRRLKAQRRAEVLRAPWKLLHRPGKKGLVGVGGVAAVAIIAAVAATAGTTTTSVTATNPYGGGPDQGPVAIQHAVTQAQNLAATYAQDAWCGPLMHAQQYTGTQLLAAAQSGVNQWLTATWGSDQPKGLSASQLHAFQTLVTNEAQPRPYKATGYNLNLTSAAAILPNVDASQVVIHPEFCVHIDHYPFISSTGGLKFPPKGTLPKSVPYIQYLNNHYMPHPVGTPTGGGSWIAFEAAWTDTYQGKASTHDMVWTADWRGVEHNGHLVPTSISTDHTYYWEGMMTYKQPTWINPANGTVAYPPLTSGIPTKNTNEQQPAPTPPANRKS